MKRQSKRTSAPIPPQGVPPVPRQPGPVLPPGFPSMVGPGAWCAPCPPQSTVASSAPCWLREIQLPGIVGSTTQGPWWTPSGSIGGSASSCPVGANVDDRDLEAWGVDPHPPGGFMNFLKNPAQAASNASASLHINVDDVEDGSDCARTEKRLLWTKEEDLRLFYFRTML